MKLTKQFMIPIVLAQCEYSDFRVQSVSDWSSTFPTYPAIDTKFYQKFVNYHGYPVTSSGHTSDTALLETTKWVCLMLSAANPTVREAMIERKGKMVVLATYPLDKTTTVPEFSFLAPAEYWDERARGLGATTMVPTGACAEENVMCHENDRYKGECIMIHEFAHAMTLLSGNTTFFDSLSKVYANAKEKGLWADTYSATNSQEYFADGVQAWMGCQSYSQQPNGVDGPINTIEAIQEYDPDLYYLIQGFFSRNFNLRYTCPSRKHFAPNGVEITISSIPKATPKPQLLSDVLIY